MEPLKGIPAALRGPIALSCGDADRAERLRRIFDTRGFGIDFIELQPDLAIGGRGSIAVAPSALPTPDRAAALAPVFAQAAANQRPIVVLDPLLSARQPRDAAAARAFLESYGAAISASPRAWVEATVWLAQYPLPRGRSVAVVAPPTSLVATEMRSLAAEQRARGTRHSANWSEAKGADVVLVDAGYLACESPPRDISIPIIPIVDHGELRDHPGTLVGVRPVLAAAALLGSIGERIAAGLGPGLRSAVDSIEPDRERFARQLRKLGKRAGDHESKVLLTCYGIPITRQAVATTPSAATRIAKRAGFPVDIKAWGAEVLTEPDGCAVESGLTTAADVRRAFSAVGETGAVIVRATPPSGREVRIRIYKLRHLGWTVELTMAWRDDPVYAPAPLSDHDAARLAHHAVSTRATDTADNIERLADVFRRASLLVTDNADTVETVDLCRIVSSTEDEHVVVVDAATDLRR